MSISRDLIARIKNNDEALKSLELYWHDPFLKDEDIRELTDALKNNTHVVKINLGVNQITHVGVQYIADLLNNNPDIIFLNLGSNVLGNAGAVCIANILKNNVLQGLNLDNANIGDHGLRCIAKAIETNTSLLSLSFHLNPVSMKGIGYMANALKKNSSLIKLDGIQDKENLIPTCIKINSQLQTKKAELLESSSLNQVEIAPQILQKNDEVKTTANTPHCFFPEITKLDTVIMISNCSQPSSTLTSNKPHG